jgi:hypothetical protein
LCAHWEFITMAKTKATAADHKSGRDQNGRFTKGNPGGPGNPQARRVALLRSILINTTTEADVHEVADKLKELAKEGDVPAIKLLFAYVLGKPTEPACDPDQLNAHEWAGWEKDSKIVTEMFPLGKYPNMDDWMKVLRKLREQATDKEMRALYGMFTASDKEFAQCKKDLAGMKDGEAMQVLHHVGDAKHWDELKAAADAAPSPNDVNEPRSLAPGEDAARAQETAKATNDETPSANGTNGHGPARGQSRGAKPHGSSEKDAPSANGKNGHGPARSESPGAKPNGSSEKDAPSANGKNGHGRVRSESRGAKLHGSSVKGAPLANGSNRVVAWLPKELRKGRKIAGNRF